MSCKNIKSLRADFLSREGGIGISLEKFQNESKKLQKNLKNKIFLAWVTTLFYLTVEFTFKYEIFII